VPDRCAEVERRSWKSVLTHETKINNQNRSGTDPDHRRENNEPKDG
jgi:hypothetical protein